MAPISQSFIVTSYPKAKQGMAMAVFGTGVVLGPVIAPVLGGYLTDALSWRWVFFMIVPCTVIFDIARYTMACQQLYSRSQTAVYMANLQIRLVALANLI